MSADVLTAEELRALAAGTAPAPDLQPVADLMTGALIRLLVEVRAPRGVAQLHGWLSSREGVLAAPLLDGKPPADARYRLVVIHPTHVLAHLCNILEVGPRVRAADLPAQVPAAVLDALAAGSAGDGEDVPESLRAAAEGLRQVWSVRATWAGPDGQERRSSVEVIDATTGYLLVERSAEDAGTAELTAVTPTDVLCLLRHVLPSDADLEV